MRFLERRIFRRPTLLMSTLLFALAGVCFTLDNTAGRTPITQVSSSIFGLVMLGISALGFWAITRPLPTWGTLWALMPQQVILIMATAGAIVDAFIHHYVGTDQYFSTAHILVTQGPLIVMGLVFTAALIQAHQPYLIRRKDIAEALKLVEEKRIAGGEL